jgi:hypothetical protein
VLIWVLPEATNGGLSEGIFILKLYCPFYFLVLKILYEILLLLDCGNVNCLLGSVSLGFLELRDASLDSLWPIATCDFLL